MSTQNVVIETAAQKLAEDVTKLGTPTNIDEYRKYHALLMQSGLYDVTTHEGNVLPSLTLRIPTE